MTHPDTQRSSATSDDAVRVALRWASFYARRGYQPLPSSRSQPGSKKKGHPPCRYASWWEGGGPAASELWRDWPEPNIQVMTGRYWRLGVIDLDGSEALEVWPSLGRLHPRTWESTSGGGGRHLWYTLPDGLPERPKRVIWRGEGSHSAIEFLCDRSLVTAPPSIHPSGRLYRFRSGHSPRDLPQPAMIPRWMLDLPSVDLPRPSVAMPDSTPRPVRKVSRARLTDGVTRNDVLDAIRDKTAVAVSWGLRIASDRMTANGWISCHDFDREDRHPSARFHPETGRFWRPGSKPVSLFDLGVERGFYADWLSCCADLSATYLPSCQKETRCL